MTKEQKKLRDELMSLMRDNPNLPVIPFVNGGGEWEICTGKQKSGTWRSGTRRDTGRESMFISIARTKTNRRWTK